MTYRDKGTRDIALGVNSKAARSKLPVALHKNAREKMAYLQNSESLDDLRAWRGLNLHPLDRDRKGQHSIWINGPYRICFKWTARGAEDVEIVNYH